MDSDDSSLSSAPSTDDEMAIMESTEKSSKSTAQKKKQGNILTFFKQKDRSPTPPKKKREPSPEHIYVPEDNPDIAFVVMFRSRFNEAFPRGAPTVGPQDVELGVEEGAPSSDVEGLLCGLLGLVLNRKKPVEKGHYGRALEEAIQTQKSQWPKAWGTTNPISGGRSFQTMTAKERITLLHTLSLWSLNQNEFIKAMVNDAYKARTTKDRLDTNIPLSVQPWGIDGDKRRYWLVEGQSDTHFRVYRETDPHKRKRVDWFSVAGDIDTLRVVANKLVEEDGRKDAKALSERMLNAIPRFEASEVKRKRREYRVNRNAAFTRPEPGFSMYEGRTRGKRLRYTYSDEEDFDSDIGTRRSTRTSGRETPAVPAGPTVTASGRQVRSRATGMYGESLLSGQVSDRASPATGDYVRSDVSEEPQQPHAHGRATRAAGRGGTNGRVNRALDSDGDDDATSWDGGDEDEDEPEGMVLDDDDDEGGDNATSSEDEEEHNSLMVTLRYAKGSFNDSNDANTNGLLALDIADRNATEHQGQPSNAPLAGHGEPRQPVQHAPVPIDTMAHSVPAPVMATASQVRNGDASLSRPSEAAAAATASPATLYQPSPVTLSKPEALFPVVPANHTSTYQAPTQSVQYPPVQPIVVAQAQQHHQPLPPMVQHQAQQQPQVHPQPPFASNSLPPQTSATNWQ